MTRRLIKLGAFLTAGGQHSAAWRHPEVASDAGVNFPHYVENVRLAESGKFDLMFLADNAGVWEHDMNSDGTSSRAAYFEPITLLSGLAAVTQNIGLVSTATTSFNEPYNIARKFASLDLISGGRAGVNLVTSANPAEALNFGYDQHLLHAARYDRAREFSQVLLGLWESWEDDAFLRDKASGQFFDPAKLHTLNHQGKHFSVRGPLNVPRSPQGRPVVVQAGSSDDGQDLAAQVAEIVFTAANVFEDAARFFAELKGRLADYGRAPETLKILPGFYPVIGATRQEARDKHEQLQSYVHPKLGLATLANHVAGMDLSAYPLDGPLPEPPQTNEGKGRQKLVVDMARRENLSIRQVYLRFAPGRGHHISMGTTTDVADEMEHWFLNGAADGFNIMPPSLPGGLRDFVTRVVPELQRRGLFRTEYEGATLRENLGLPFPTRRHDTTPMAARA